MGLALAASPAAAAPFAYVTNSLDNTVSVIDTATHPPSVVATVPVGSGPEVVAVTPDGKHAYVLNSGGTVSVIRTATNRVVATVGVPPGGGGGAPNGVAFAPDGKHAYVANLSVNTVSVIDTTTKMVVATIPVGNEPDGVAVTPDGNHVYVVNSSDAGGGDTVSVIDTASNTVVAPIPVGNVPNGLVITPDGKHVYVANLFSNTVSVIRTATNTVVDTLPVGNLPVGIAITPDGKHAYVITNDVLNNFWVIDTTTRTVVAMVPGGGTALAAVAVTPDGKYAYVVDQPAGPPGFVSVLRTDTNTVVATVPVGRTPSIVGIVPPPPGVPFLAFSATALDIDFGGSPIFNLHSQFTLSSTAPAINPVTQPVSFQVGTYSTTIPSGSFAKQLDGSFLFEGVIDGVSLTVHIRPTATLQYTFHAKATTGASLTKTTNPVYVTLIIGGDSGATAVTAAITP